MSFTKDRSVHSSGVILLPLLLSLLLCFPHGSLPRSEFSIGQRSHADLCFVSLKGGAHAQSYVSTKTVEMNFQFRKEREVENELSVVCMTGAALA